MEQNNYRISQICSIKSGKRLPAGTDFSLEPTKYKYIRARDIKAGKIILDDVAYIDEETKQKINKYIINKGDIAITIVANIGDIGYADSKCDGINLTENAVRLTKFDKDIVNSKYLAYYLSQPLMKTYMENLAAGAAQAKLGIYKIEKMKIQLPNIAIQNDIVNVIEKFDSLIELNTKRIKTLEQMAENLYKEWFVRFRFPGHEKAEFEDTKLGELPSSFQILKMKDVISYYIGGGWGNDEEDKDFSVEAYVIRGTDFPNVSVGNLSTCPLRYHKQSNYNSRKMQKHDIVIEISGGTDEKPVGRSLLVTQDVLERFDNRVICASFCKLVRLNFEVVSPIFFYYWMQFLYDTRIIDRYQLQSTGIINFQFEYFLKKGDIMIPPKELMEKFDELIEPIHNEIAALSKQNENLIKQRDLLLPRLMSGKLEV